MTNYNRAVIGNAFRAISSGESDYDRELVKRGFEEFARLCHDMNKNWWLDPKTGEPIARNYGGLISLMHSEVSEGMEAHRKNERMDDKLPHRKGLEVELADALIRIGDFIGGTNSNEEFGYVIDAIRSHDGDIKEDLKTDDVAEKLASIHYELSLAYHMHRHQNNFRFMVVHLSRAVIKAIYTADALGYDLFFAAMEKTDYNRTRIDHTLEYRRTATDGKAY